MNFQEFIPWLKAAQEIAETSQHPTVKVGAILVDAKGIEITKAANGFAPGVEPSEERLRSPDRANWIECAEMLTVGRAAAEGKASKGATLYSNLFPCYRCAGAIVAAGIARVVVVNRPFPPGLSPRTLEAMAAGQAKLEEARIPVIRVSSDLIT